MRKRHVAPMRLRSSSSLSSRHVATSSSAPLAQHSPPLIVPGNETQLHFRCKEYLASQLSSAATKRLVIGIRCSTRQRGAAVPPFWSCTEHRPALLAENWAHVRTEFSAPRIGRFDVALLGANRKLLAALEVFHKGAVSDIKLRRLQRRAIRWAEMKVSPDFYEGRYAWNISQPLPTFRTPFKPYVCPRCAAGWADVRFTHISAMCDVFPLGSYISTRHIFAEFRTPTGPVQVETAFRAYQGVVDEEKEAILLGAGSVLPEPISNSAAVILQPQSHALLMQRLADLRHSAAAFDLLLPPPGLSLPALLAKDDKLRFDLKSIHTPMMLFPTLRRLYPQKFHWHYGKWKCG